MSFIKLQQRPESDRTFPSVRRLQQYYRATLPQDSLRAEMQKALRLMEEMGLGFKQGPQPTSPKPKVKSQGLAPRPRIKNTQHIERQFVFSSGETKRCCTYVDCNWGRGRKTHSDGSKSGTYLDLPEADLSESEVEEPEGEPSNDSPQELSFFEEQIPVAGVDGEDELAPESDLGNESDPQESVQPLDLDGDDDE